MLAVEQANADIRAITEANAGSESEIAVLKNESEHSRFRIDEAASELSAPGRTARASSARPRTTAPPSRR